MIEESDPIILTGASAPSPSLGRGALHVVEHNFRLYRSRWMVSMINNVLGPVAWLAAMGLGIGNLVDRHVGTVEGLPYLVFMAPGFMATSAMQMGANLSSHPIMGKVRWHDTYVAVLSTPVSVLGIMLGEFGWIGVRLLQGSAIFAIVMVAFGAVRSPWVVAAIPVCALTGLAFATPISIISGISRNDLPFAVVWTVVIFPMMMFGGALFPLTQLPGPLQVVAWALPLAHGVALARALSTGTATLAPALLHLAVLAAYIVAGGVLSCLAMRRTLEP